MRICVLPTQLFWPTSPGYFLEIAGPCWPVKSFGPLPALWAYLRLEPCGRDKTRCLCRLRGWIFQRSEVAPLEKFVGSLFSRCCNRCLVEFFGDEHRNFAFAQLNDGKSVIVKSAVRLMTLDHWRHSYCKELRAGSKAGPRPELVRPMRRPAGKRSR